MNRIEQDILNEVKMIEKECLEKGISPIEWIARHAEEYRRKLGMLTCRKSACLNKRG